MRRIKVIHHVSLDGVSRPEGDDDYANGGWTVPFRSADGREAVAAAHSGCDLLLGRRTYDQFAEFWPKAPSSPIADSLNAATKYVATHRPINLGWGPVLDLGSDALSGVRDLTSKEGPDLLVIGSLTLVSTLLEQSLVEEVLLIVYPITLGRGRRLFPETAEPRELALVSTRMTSKGGLLNRYRLVGPLRK